VAQVYNGFSSYRLFAAYLTAARLNAGLTEAARRLSERRWLISTNDLPTANSVRVGAGRAPAACSTRNKGLTAYAARLDAAICRHEYLG
jgi:hypothetical protein